MHGPRAEEEDVPGASNHRHGARGVDRRSIDATVRVEPRRVPRDELEGAIVFIHVVDEQECLHVRAATGDVAPGAWALVTVLDVLMPVERDSVVRHLEVRLTEELLALRGPEELERGLDEAAVLAQSKQQGLRASGPDDALHDHRPRRRSVEDEQRSRMLGRVAEALRLLVETLERAARGSDLVRREELRDHEEPMLVERPPERLADPHRHGV